MGYKISSSTGRVGSGGGRGATGKKSGGGGKGATQRTVAPARGYGQSPTGRNSTAAERALNRSGPGSRSATTRGTARQSATTEAMNKARSRAAQRAKLESAYSRYSGGEISNSDYSAMRSEAKRIASTQLQNTGPKSGFSGKYGSYSGEANSGPTLQKEAKTKSKKLNSK